MTSDSFDPGSITPVPAAWQTAGQPAHGRDPLLWHDLRDALADMRAGLMKLASENLEPSQRSQLERATMAGEALDRLMALAANEGTESTDQQMPVNLRRFLHGLETRHGMRAIEAGLAFQLFASPDLPPAILTNRTALERLLNNLLSNALRQSSHGCITLTARVARDQRHIDILIADVGSRHGWSASPAQPDGFDPWLVICRQMADKLGATLTFSDTPTGNSVASIRVPAAMMPALDPGAHPMPDLAQLRVLLVEASTTCRLLLARLFAQFGADLDAAESGAQALARLGRDVPDLVVIDTNLTDMPGIELIHQIRALRGPAAQVPILMVTAEQEPETELALLRAGADAVIQKPLTGIDDMAQALSTLPLGAGTRTGLPDRLLSLLSIADAETANDLIGQLAQDLADVRNRLRSALHLPDLNDLRDQSHILIALAGSVGAVRLQALAQRLHLASQHGTSLLLPDLGRLVIDCISALLDEIAETTRKM